MMMMIIGTCVSINEFSFDHDRCYDSLLTSLRTLVYELNFILPLNYKCSLSTHDILDTKYVGVELCAHGELTISNVWHSLLFWYFEKDRPPPHPLCCVV